jgi:hypothetical protein
MKRLLLAGFVLAYALPVFGQVSVRTLLPQMTDLSRLARRPSPYFTTAQASSYDRASKDPATDWFANGDAGKFLRAESRPGRTEYVMADLKGPGAVVRIWSANPTGVVRFYFDGESEARFQAKMADLLGGKVQPFRDPFGYFSARGANLYFPFPYSRSLKVTVDDSDGDRVRGLYYHVGYRTYELGTMVRTFRPEELPLMTDLIEDTGDALVEAYPSPTGKSTGVTAEVVYTGKSATIAEVAGPSEIVELRLQVVPRDPVLPDSEGEWRLYRSLILEAWFDEEKCIEVPVGDFFGSAPGLVRYRTLPIEVDGQNLVCRLPMPFAKSALIKVTNLGPNPAILSCRVVVRPIVFDASTYHLKAQWGGERASTRPMRDMTFLATTGEGTFVGTNLFVENPVDAWWGEGDEKIWVDRDPFPSTFGTGTEDYYGYAWCDVTTFQRPYHMQPRCDGEAFRTNRGHTLVGRWHVIDPLPYRQKFKFDLEMWHWQECVATFVHTAYWYARPGTPGPRRIDSTLLLPRPVPGPESVEGAIEGEKMKVVGRSGGITELQAFTDLSAGRQFWWRDAKPGDRLVLEFDVEKAGRYKVVGHFCQARDYGTHRLRLAGKEVDGSPLDFYSKDLGWAKRTLGVFDLPAGKTRLEVEVAGTNPAAEPRHMFGLDYLILENP